jgi:integral membrane protein
MLTPMTSSAPDWRRVAQPPLPPGTVARCSGDLLRYRIMAFATGVALALATVVAIVRYSGADDLKPVNAVLWIVHGWLYVVYLIVTAILGFRLRWPLPRYALVMLAGTIPTMSFVAEHYVTRAARAAEHATSAGVPG